MKNRDLIAVTGLIARKAAIWTHELTAENQDDDAASWSTREFYREMKAVLKKLETEEILTGC